MMRAALPGNWLNDGVDYTFVESRRQHRPLVRRHRNHRCRYRQTLCRPSLVYIAALAPDADETSQSQLKKFPVTDISSHIEVADGRIWLRPGGIECFARELSEEAEGRLGDPGRTDRKSL
jgi:hypothetical protein